MCIVYYFINNPFIELYRIFDKPFDKHFNEASDEPFNQIFDKLFNKPFDEIFIQIINSYYIFLFQFLSIYNYPIHQ